MTTLRDILRDMVNEAIDEAAKSEDFVLEDSEQIVDRYIEHIKERLIG